MNEKMNELEFKKLIDLYQQGKLSGRENALVEEWFEAMGTDNVHQLWAAEDKLHLKNKILDQLQKGEAFQLSGPASRPPRKWAVVATRLAASTVLIIAASWVIWHYAGSKGTQEVVNKVISTGTVGKTILPDGSIAWLKGSSTLTYPEKFDGAERHVTLTGEALFEVAKDPAHPFLIQCGALTAKVLGTSFNIRASEKNIEVMVLTGKVVLTSASDQQGMVVLPNEKATYDNLKKEIAKSVTAKEERIATIADTQYNMDFEDITMKEVIRRIEGKFNVQVEVVDQQLQNCRVTANFTDQSLKNTLTIITKVLTVQYEMNGTKIELKGKGCDR
jgi:transmembrane sensor